MFFHVNSEALKYLYNRVDLFIFSWERLHKDKSRSSLMSLLISSPIYNDVPVFFLFFLGGNLPHMSEEHMTAQSARARGTYSRETWE